MKKSNIVLSIVLILLVLVGWGMLFLNGARTNSQYNTYLRLASQYNEAGLYQKAIQSYEGALQIKEKHEVRELWIESYNNAYLDKAVSLNAYVTALETMCDLHVKDTEYWDRLITLQMNHGNINDAYKTLMKFQSAGLSSAVVDEYSDDIVYALKIKNKSYIEFVRNISGYYTVHDNGGWGIIRPNGETVYDCMYEYISPYNANFDALFISEKGQRIADAKAVIQAKINIEYLKTGAWNDGLLPVCEENGNWYYLDCQGNERVHGSYKNASNYASGIAAVFNGSEWILVNTTGEAVCQKKFSDIKLHSNGDYQFGGIMIAAENGRYGIYNANGDLLNDFHAKDMDVYMGESIAYCDETSGKWGMVSTNGEIIVKPTYCAAKSFSSGLAAVSDGEKWGFINHEGRVVINYQFLEADYFTANGICVVSVLPAEYNIIQRRFLDK